MPQPVMAETVHLLLIKSVMMIIVKIIMNNDIMPQSFMAETAHCCYSFFL